MFDRAQCLDRFVGLLLRGSGHLIGVFSKRTGRFIDAFGSLTDLFHQLRKPLNHEVERVGHVSEHVGCHFTTLRQVSLTDVRHQDEEDHQPLLQLVAFAFRLREGRRNVVQHGVEPGRHLTDLLFRRHFGARLIVAGGGQLRDLCDMSQIFREELGNPIPDAESKGHRDESSDNHDDRTVGGQGLGIFVEILRHIVQIQYLLVVACDDLIEWPLQIHPQGQDSEFPHVLCLCGTSGSSQNYQPSH